MATELQIAANRLNAQKSTGPKTPEGRAAVRLNGVKHGITAQTLVLKGENQEDFTALLESYEAEHQPAIPTEEALVLQLAMATWRLRRLYHAEAAFSASKLKLIAGTDAGRNLKDSERLGLVNDYSHDTMATFNRQESRLERTFYRALHELQRLRKLALVSQPADVERVSEQPAKQINHIQVATPAPDPPSEP